MKESILGKYHGEGRVGEGLLGRRRFLGLGLRCGRHDDGLIETQNEKGVTVVEIETRDR